jgi:hypothetical protein
MEKLRCVCFSVLALWAVLMSPGSAKASFEKGLEARAAGDFEEALHQWMLTSDDVRSVTAIGSLYDHGEGLPQDKEKAVEWYAKAAEMGGYRAMAQLAKFSLTGTGGVAQSPTEWRGRLEEIEGRDAYADYILAYFYLGGHGGERNISRGHAILNALVNNRGLSQLADELKRAEALLAARETGVLDVEALVNEIARDRAAFEENYKDRRVIVNGWLNSIERMNDYGYVVRFGGTHPSTVPKDGILAVFYDPSRTGTLSSLEPGMFVKFSGVYVGDHPFPLGDSAFTLFGCALTDTVSEDPHP